jgi:hypothetical protein
MPAGPPAPGRVDDGQLIRHATEPSSFARLVQHNGLYVRLYRTAIAAPQRLRRRQLRNRLCGQPHRNGKRGLPLPRRSRCPRARGAGAIAVPRPDIALQFSTFSRFRRWQVRRQLPAARYVSCVCLSESSRSAIWLTRSLLHGVRESPTPQAVFPSSSARSQPPPLPGSACAGSRQRREARPRLSSLPVASFAQSSSRLHSRRATLNGTRAGLSR